MSNINLSDLVIRNIHALNKVNIKISERKNRYNRERWAIAIKTNGKSMYESNGKKYFSDINHMILLPKGISYTFQCIEFGECFMIEFEAELNASNCEITCYKINNILEIITIFNRIEHLWTFKKPAYKIKCMAGLYEILAKLYEFDSVDYQLSSKFDLIKPAVNYLEEHYNDTSLTNEKLSALLGISTVYFRKIFTSIYNVSPMKYIQMIRIEKAKDMLVGDFSSITKIAENTGFSSIYHFSKSFKNLTGYTPSEFARHNSQINF